MMKVLEFNSKIKRMSFVSWDEVKACETASCSKCMDAWRSLQIL